MSVFHVFHVVKSDVEHRKHMIQLHIRRFVPRVPCSTSISKTPYAVYVCCFLSHVRTYFYVEHGEHNDPKRLKRGTDVEQDVEQTWNITPAA